MITFHIITLFPEAIAPYLKTSLLGRALKKKLVRFSLVQLRDFSRGKHRAVDDRVYGGGPGMVLQVEPIFRATQRVKREIEKKRSGRRQKYAERVILFSTRGKPFTQKEARRLARYRDLIFICGRYEGVDERVAKYIADEELSLGPFVLSGGELPALAVTEAVARHIPGVLGREESLEEKKGSYPVYTRPEVFRMPVGAKPGSRANSHYPARPGSRAKLHCPARRVGKWRVPPVLLSGDHRKINAWRQSGGA